MPSSKSECEHFSACLLGGAVGETLGAPLEFLFLTEIRGQFQHDGFTEADLSVTLTDDTQMTLFSTSVIACAIDYNHGVRLMNRKSRNALLVKSNRMSFESSSLEGRCRKSYNGNGFMCTEMEK